jgi:hypothetical protein
MAEAIHTIQVEQEKDGRNQISDECDKEVDDALSEKQLPE